MATLLILLTINISTVLNISMTANTTVFDKDCVDSTWYTVASTDAITSMWLIVSCPWLGSPWIGDWICRCLCMCVVWCTGSSCSLLLNSCAYAYGYSITGISSVVMGWMGWLGWLGMLVMLGMLKDCCYC